MEPGTITCKNCGEQFTGNYCNNCGEKVFHPHHKKIHHLSEEVFHFLTHFEGSIPRTFRAVFTRPGQLSLDYCNGIRKRYFKPLSLFLMCIVIYLLFSPFQGLNMKFHTYVNDNYRYAWYVKPLLKKKLGTNIHAYEKFAEKYNEESPHISKVLLLVLLPAMAGLLFLLFYKRDHYYFDHFILATEFGSLWIAFKFILLPTIMLIGMQFNPSFINYFSDNNGWLWLTIDLLLLVYLCKAFRRFYKQKWLWTILKAMVFLFIFEYILLFFYHLLLFYVVMLFI